MWLVIKVSSYRIVKRVGKVAYELELTRKMDMVHLVFHVLC